MWELTMYIVFLHYYTYDWFIQILFLTRSNMKVRGVKKKMLVAGLPAFSHAQVIFKDNSYVSEVCRVETGGKVVGCGHLCTVLCNGTWFNLVCNACLLLVLTEEYLSKASSSAVNYIQIFQKAINLWISQTVAVTVLETTSDGCKIAF